MAPVTGTNSATVSNERFRIAADGKVSLGAGGSLEAVSGDLNIGASTSVTNIATSASAQTVNIGAAGAGATTVNMTGQLTVTGNVSSSVAPTTNNHLTNKAYVDSKIPTELYQEWSTAFNGPTGLSSPMTFQLCRQGRVVTITNTVTYSTSATVATSYLSVDKIPVEYRTWGGVACPILICNGSTTWESGIAWIDNDGAITMKPINGTFKGTGHTTWWKWSISYVRVEQ